MAAASPIHRDAMLGPKAVPVPAPGAETETNKTGKLGSVQHVAPPDSNPLAVNSNSPPPSVSNAPALASTFPQEQPRPMSASSSPSPAVRFASNIETISAEPSDISCLVSPPTSLAKDATRAVTPDQIRDLSRSLEGAPLQEKRLSIFGFEPYSLPPSRIHSEETQSRVPSRQASGSTLAQPSSPLPNSRPAEMQSPPLTPSGTGPARSTDDITAAKTRRTRTGNDASTITPQASSSQGAVSPLGGLDPLVRPPSDNPSEPAASPDESDRGLPPHRRGMFSVGPRSVPVSRESSPSRPASQFYSRPLTPSGDMNDPYAATKRPPQDHKNIDPRFVFSRKNKWSPSSSYTNLAKSARNAYEPPEKRKSALGGATKTNRSDELQPNDSATPTIHRRQSSMADLKRFFKAAVGGGGAQSKKSSLSTTNSARSKSSATSKLAHQVPFGDDHGLTNRWGRLGKVLGSGAGGSVRLMRRTEDGTIFAVKEFRPRHSYETDKDYVKKLTGEFCMGSTLHHGNIIETLDIVSERGKWYEVMEYAPYDLFAIVMTGKMSRAEVTCCWLQILSGVTYLHSLGLSHRDLKLDNVVVSEHGIIKIIDFGSAHVFQYPFESTSVLASGIVGSDPYLAPEVYDDRKYDAPGVDIWSLAIIFCCMSLRRFPWKLPRITDNSYKLFASKPTPGHDPEEMIHPRRSDDDLEPAKPGASSEQPPHEAKAAKDSRPVPDGTDTREALAVATGSSSVPEKKEVIKGPWRLLRLLPRESRHIIYRMLQLDPAERASMSEILEEPWVANMVICRQLEPGNVIAAEDHTHILEPPVSGPK